MIDKNNTNKNLQSNEENNVQRKNEIFFLDTSFPPFKIEYIFDKNGNKIGENWYMNNPISPLKAL